ncbi:hypothetical protein JCM11251_003377 [Rhodosporidiobolus azoricus]
MLSPRWPSPLTTLLRHSARSSPSTFPSSSLRKSYNRSLCSTTTPTYTSSSRTFLRSYRTAVALSLAGGAAALASTASKPFDCASDRSTYAQTAPAELAAAGGEGGKPVPKEAESILNLRDLGFGTVSGICVGVFVKKGLRMAAFVLGGAFIFLQYMSSRSLINVNWPSIASSYDSFITKRAGPPATEGGNRLGGLWRWFVDFVGANIQQRATFVAGIALGLRIG